MAAWECDSVMEFTNDYFDKVGQLMMTSDVYWVDPENTNAERHKQVSDKFFGEELARYFRKI
jgi:hypothetical protein